MEKQHLIYDWNQKRWLTLGAKQWYQSKGANPKVTCGCGFKAPIRLLYRCLYCELFFCKSCAEEHFGKTREDYWNEHAK